jgi:hypothetical protein
MYLELLLNGVFSNGSFKEEPLLNGSVIFLGLTFALTFIFLLQLITFAPMDCPSHRSLISIQRSKNKNLKTKIPRINNHFYLFSYIKREMRETKEKEERRERRDIKNKN